VSSEALAEEDTLRRVVPKTQEGPRLLSRGAPQVRFQASFVSRFALHVSRDPLHEEWDFAMNSHESCGLVDPVGWPACLSP
jgi:hypothetical protein